MLRRIRIAIAANQHKAAARRAKAYIRAPYGEWNPGLQIAYDRAESEAAKKLARLVNPGLATITRGAW